MRRGINSLARMVQQVLALDPHRARSSRRSPGIVPPWAALARA
ncbi:hypothetical protein [Mesorhizobium sp. C399B]